MNQVKPRVSAVAWKDNACIILEQTLLPSQEIYLECRSYREVNDAIRRLAVRGAPAIGVAGAYAVVLAAREACDTRASVASFLSSVEEIATARPTAVNLRWAVQRMLKKFSADVAVNEEQIDVFAREAAAIHAEDIAFNARMAAHGAAILPGGKAVMTYCNTGDLATGGIGTALGIIRQGYLEGKVSHVYPCETRPVMQGSRLTVWELYKNEIPFTLLCDNMAAVAMRQGKIGAVITGADRIAANGDSANKVGTYSLAVLAKHHGIPFYIAAPSSTFDLAIRTGEQIPIEERHADEILGALGKNQHSAKVGVFNPSFDVTPASLITAIICERGVIPNPTEKNVTALLA